MWSERPLLVTCAARDCCWLWTRKMVAKDHCCQHWYDKRLLLVMINSLLVAIKVDGSERSLLVVFMPQEYYWLLWQQEITADSVVQREIVAGHDQVAVGCDQGIWQREITVGSVVLREIAATCDQGRWQHLCSKICVLRLKG
ncbi:hypothetical protein BHM03_00020095 [Ensete ventricosum]|nr:hypothetical protein BHM03_00020095 [Ensete ventricosum]